MNKLTTHQLANKNTKLPQKSSFQVNNFSLAQVTMCESLGFSSSAALTHTTIRFISPTLSNQSNITRVHLGTCACRNFEIFSGI